MHFHQKLNNVITIQHSSACLIKALIRCLFQTTWFTVGVFEVWTPAYQGLAAAELQSVCRSSRSSFWCSQLWTADSQSECPARSSQPVPVSPLWTGAKVPTICNIPERKLTHQNNNKHLKMFQYHHLAVVKHWWSDLSVLYDIWETVSCLWCKRRVTRYTSTVTDTRLNSYIYP